MLKFHFFPKDPVNNIPTLIPIMAWRRQSDKTLSEPMMVWRINAPLGLNELSVQIYWD